MAESNTVLVELEPHEVLTLRDALLYYAEFSSDDLHQKKAQRAADLRQKLLQSFLGEVVSPALRTVAG